MSANKVCTYCGSKNLIEVDEASLASEVRFSGGKEWVPVACKDCGKEQDSQVRPDGR